MIKNRQNSQKIDQPFDVWLLQADDKIKLLTISFKPGEGIPLHSNSERVIFYVLKGKGVLKIDLNEHVLVEGDSFLVSENLQRGWENTSQEKLEILVLKQTFSSE